jgi:hypothetical protein
MILTTFDFQAPEFYAKHGFHTLAIVDDYPDGHASLLLQKVFVGQEVTGRGHRPQNSPQYH